MTGTTRRAHMPVAARRAQLVEAAMAVMRRDGAWSLTTRAVATEAGVPLGAVHYAFGSKAELVRAVFGADIESAADVIGGATRAGGSAEEILLRSMQRYAVALRGERRTELVLQELVLMGVRDGELAALGAESVQGYRTEITRFLTGLATRCGGTWDGPVEVLAEILFAQLVGLAQNWLATGDEALMDACLQDVAVALARRLQT